MTKRRLSPEALPSPKRQHTASTQRSSQGPSHHQATSIPTLYDEIVLVILSFLSYNDLCAIQRTNRNWSRLALDNQLWKKLYLGEYGRTRLRGGRGFIGRSDEKEVKPLPSRTKPDDIDDGRDWKWMFRISSNWRTGRCSKEQVLPRCGGPTLSDGSPVNQNPEARSLQTLLAGSFIVVGAQDNTLGPSLCLIAPTNNHYTLSCRTTRSDRSTVITKLALDQSPPSNTRYARLAVFLSTGEFIVFSLDHSHPDQSSRLRTYQPVTRVPRTAPIVQAVYHDQLLVTLSKSFHLSIYDLRGPHIAHTQTLSSFTSYPPSSMVLTPTSDSTYKLVLTYAAPVFPAHWSVGATELIISSASSMIVSSSRTARAMDVPAGWVDDSKMRALREQWSRKVDRVADTQTDGKWVVLAASEATSPALPNGSAADLSPTSLYSSTHFHSPNALQLYRLHLPSGTSNSSAKLVFVRYLHGQLGPVSSVSLADGRCVSLGVNGSIWVWDLEGASGAEVYPGLVTKSASGSLTKSSVVFDEKRIITTSDSGVELRRFDI